MLRKRPGCSIFQLVTDPDVEISCLGGACGQGFLCPWTKSYCLSHSAAFVVVFTAFEDVCCGCRIRAHDFAHECKGIVRDNEELCDACCHLEGFLGRKVQFEIVVMVMLWCCVADQVEG